MKRFFKCFFFALILLIPNLVRSQTYVVIDTELKTCKTKEGSAYSPGEIINPYQKDNLFSEKVLAKRTDYYGNVLWSGSCSLIEIPDYSLYINSNNVQWNMTLYIPKTIEKIGIDPFQNFSRHYTKISYAGDLEAWCKIQMSSTSSNPCSIAGDLYLNGELLKDLEVPETITALNRCAFSYCSSLENVKLHSNVTTLGNYCFSDCTNLINIEFSDNPDFFYGNYIFDGCTSLSHIQIPTNMKQIPDGTFSGCRNLKEVVFNNISSIGEKAFYLCKLLENVDLPESLVELGKYCFSSSGLTTIDIPTNVEYIGEWAFFDCKNLSEVKIGNGVKELKKYAFYNCPSLTTVTVGKSVSTIEDNVFNHGNLRVVTSLNPTPPTITNTTFNSETTEKGVLLVPEESLSLYKLSPYWMDFQRIEAIPNIGGNSGSGDQNGESIFNVKIDKYIYMTIDEEQSFSNYLPSGATASSWESSDDDIVEVTKKGKAEAYEYGNVIVRALDSDGATLLTLGVFVCPTVSIEYSTGNSSYQHHVIYNTSPTLYIAPPEDYEIASVSHDGEDITEDVLNNDGFYTTSNPITDNTVISVTLNPTKDPADLNGDGTVDVVDMNILIERMMNY